MVSAGFAGLWLEEELGLVCFYFVFTVSKRNCKLDQVLNNIRHIAWNLSLFYFIFDTLYNTAYFVKDQYQKDKL